MYNIKLLRWKFSNMGSWARKNNINNFPIELNSFKLKNPSINVLTNDFKILKKFECKSYFDFVCSFN
jgi:hypothetical protein